MSSLLENAAVKIKIIMDSSDREELDDLLWEVLWKPLEFPRSIRESFRLDGPGIEIVAKQDGRIIGGIVANWLTPTEVALRHIVVDPSIQNRGVGSLLFEQLKIVVKSVGCRLIRGYARNTSVNFFVRQGFEMLPGKTAEHPQFSKHGISFQQLIYKFQ
jgi:GNAT superfamily N-acetyltransferase